MRFWFRKDRKDPSNDKSLPVNEIAWSQDAIYSRTDTPKYNPDGLIGKKGAAVYRKMMLDEQVKAVVRFKRDAITSRGYFFDVDRDRLSDEEADRRVAISEKLVQTIRGSFTDNLNGIMSSMYQGFSMTEKLYDTFEFDGLTYWGVRDLKLRPYDTFEFVVDAHGETQRVTQTVGSDEQDIDITKFIHFTHNREYDEHYGQSELREAYRAWFSKDMAIRFWNMWLERHASGFKVMQATGGRVLSVGSKEYSDLQKVLDNAVNGTGMILPSGIDFTTSYPNNNVAFKDAMQTHDLSIAKALLVPNLMGITPAGQTGSYSQSDTQLRAFFWTLNADTKRLEETLNEQLFRELGEINFGDDDWPRFRFRPLSDEQIAALVEQWSSLLGVGAVERSDSDEEFVRQLMGFPKKDDDSAAEPGAAEPNPPGDEDQLPDETIVGRRAVTEAAFTRAEKRVNFSVLANSASAVEGEHGDAIAERLFDLTREYVTRVTAGYETWPADKTPVEIRKMKLDAALRAKVQQGMRAMFRDAWRVGQKHAAIEIDRAKRAEFSRSLGSDRILLISEEYFRTKSFKAAGDLTDDLKRRMDAVVVNGAKTGKTVAQIEADIYAMLASDGILALPALDELGGMLAGTDVSNPQARIDTMVRTNTFEAINEARFAYFTAPELDDFVEALEYSAILDSRTTQICSQLDGHIHPASSEIWDRYRPPNHYNCRALLIPVTQIDTWVESEPPTIDPQRGFD